ncbi:hypothetical protein GLW08_01480 [Pontibacillus yanchengensis]|uniref:Uncharacterized protein n=2 Tax=Pontibacillus yanchengensis TaxID=462910 RepID=A0ACC7VAU4_9BACI|nr:flagellar FlbD family protein [Pontibacillus yanchengensis]MYL33149.1 hypothetical protein [Pontibacillus yanchengensis]MYL52001.1 hypothetical protein [Pontibacillus yanchengensis]
MIALTKLNGDRFTLNAIYIEQVQRLPATTITLSNGKKVIVKETDAEVISQVKQFYRQIGLVGVQNDNEEGSS